MVKSLDQSVGHVLRTVDELGLTEDTIVIFTSDNGGLTQRYGKHDGFTENLPLRRGKGSAYEGGVRVPAMIRWPGKTQPGSVSDEPIMTIDYYPTILEMAGLKGDAEHNSALDGQSLVDLMSSPTASLERDLFWHYPHYHAGGDGPYSAIRSGSMRLIEFHEDQHRELYDLSHDIGEQRDLSSQRPELVAELTAKLHDWRDSVAAQMPSPNPNFDPARQTQVGPNR
jgi:arylsulfatase A-like enzyme